MKRSPEYLIAANQVFGALLLTDAYLASLTRGTPLPVLLVVAALAAATISGVAGVLMWRRRTVGLPLSLIVQGLQILGVAAPNFDWRLKLGVNVTIEVSRSGFMTHWGFNGLYAIGPWSVSPEFTVTFNAVALAAFAYLFKLWRRDRLMSGAVTTSVGRAV